MMTPSEEAAAHTTMAGGRSKLPACTLPSTNLPAVVEPQDARMLLAPELWLYVFSFLSARTLVCSCASVSRYWVSLALEAVKDREFAQHETFLLSQARSFLGIDRYCNKINEHLLSSDLPLVITGESGGGKSSALIQWILRYHQKRSNALVLYHFVGSPAHSTDYMNVIQRFMADLKRECNIYDDVPSTLTNLQKKFPQWLQEAGAKQPIILVIDGLSQLDEAEDSHLLNWLPERFPANVKVIVSTLRGVCYDICTQKRQWATISVEPLTRKEKALVLSRTMNDRQAQLTTTQAERIFAAPQSCNPLYLCVLLEYLPTLGNRDCVDENIDFYLQSEDALDLFVRIIERLESAFPETCGVNVVCEVLTCLYVARSGLSEGELQEILSLDEKTWRSLYKAIVPSLVTRFGLITFYHDRFRQAISRKYLSTLSSRRLASRKLSSYFGHKLAEASSISCTGSISLRVVDELPWLLERSQDYDGLKHCITNIRLFDKLFQKERKYDLFRYWVAAESDSHEIAVLYSQKLEDFQRINPNAMKEVARLAHKIGEYIRDGGHYNEAITFFLKALEIKKLEYGEDAVEVATTMNELGRLYFRLGRNEETLSIWRRALEIREMAKGGKEDHDIAISLNNLALIYEKMGRWQEAEPTYKRALEIYKQVSGPDHPDVAITYHNLGLLYSGHSSRLKDSEEMYMKALEIKERYYGKGHNELAMTLNNLGLVYSKGLQHEKAVELYKKAIEIRESIFGPDHPDVALFLFNLGVCYGKLSLPQHAKPCLLRALKIRKRVYGSGHASTAVVRSWLLYWGWSDEEEGQSVNAASLE